MTGAKRAAIELDDVFVARATPEAKPYTQFDSKVKGFGLRVFPTGVKSYILEYRAPGQGRLAGKSRMKLGEPGQMTVKKARGKADQERSRILANGADPMREKREAREAVARTKEDAAKAVEEAAKATADRVDNFVEDFLKLALARTAGDTWAREGERLLRKEVIPALGDKQLGDVKKKDVHAMLDAIVARGSPIIANRTLAIFRRLCNWAIERGKLTLSPVDKIKAPSEEPPRERVLCDDEIRLAWGAFNGLGYPFGPLAKLLLLTATRRDEAASAVWGEFDLAGKTWSIAGERTKNGEAHLIPLSDMAVAILKTLPKVEPKKDEHGRRLPAFIFTTNGRTAVSGFSKAKDEIDSAILAARKEAAGGEDVEAPARWTYHDLRRTAASGMGALGVAPHVIEAVLNHTSGKIKGIARVYNRYGYAAEKRAALDAWAQRVVEIVGGAVDGQADHPDIESDSAFST